MSIVHRRLRRAGSIVGAATAFTILAAGSAYASTEYRTYTYCDHGQLGKASWRQPNDVDSVAWTFGLWLDPDNNLVAGPDTYFQWPGPSTATIRGQGDDYWALFGIVVDAGTSLQERGESCSGGGEVAVAALRSLPLAATADRGAVPPPPTLGVGFELPYLGVE